MNIFDKYAEQVNNLLCDYELKTLPEEGELWPATERTSFIMARDSALEIGGYPKESVNLILSSSDFSFPKEGSLFILGDEKQLFGKETALSYGKIVFLKTEDISEDETYNYVKLAEMTDFKLHFQDVMTRTSTKQFYTNLRIGKQALKNGISMERIGRTMLDRFRKIPQVCEVKIILILGDSPLYKQLLPLAWDVKQITIALNTMFDGMDLDCGSCSLSPICDEVEGLRQMHTAVRAR